MRKRKNPDEDLRKLERAAQTDPRAWERLTVERIRRGLDEEIEQLLRASRGALVHWLTHNDPNGDYDDSTIPVNELRTIAIAQVIDGRASPPGTGFAEDFMPELRR